MVVPSISGMICLSLLAIPLCWLVVLALLPEQRTLRANRRLQRREEMTLRVENGGDVLAPGFQQVTQHAISEGDVSYSLSWAWRGSLLVWFITGTLALASAVWWGGLGRNPAQFIAAHETSIEISNQVLRVVSRVLPMVESGEEWIENGNSSHAVRFLEISPLRMAILAMLCGVGLALMLAESRARFRSFERSENVNMAHMASVPTVVGEAVPGKMAALGVSVGLLGLVLLAIACPLVLLIVGAHLITLAVLLCQFAWGDRTASIPRVLISLQRWLLHQLPGDLLLLVAAMLLVQGFRIDGFEDLERVKAALPGSYEFGLLEMGILCWFLGCLPKLFLFPAMLSAGAIAELSAGERATKVVGLASPRLALAVAVLSAGTGVLLLERSWPLMAQASLAGGSAGRELASQLSSISVVLCGWMFLSGRVLAVPADEPRIDRVPIRAGVLEQNRSGIQGPKKSAGWNEQWSDPGQCTLLLATLLSLTAFQFFQWAGEAGDLSFTEIDWSEAWSRCSWLSGWVLGAWWLISPVGQHRWWMGMGWLSLAWLPIDLEGVKLWQQMAILLGMLWLTMGIMWPATREVEHQPRPGGWALFVASCLLMGVYVLLAVPGELFLSFIEHGQVPWRVGNLLIASTALTGGLLAILLGRETVRALAWRTCGEMMKPLLELGRDHLLVEKLFFWGIHLPVRGIAQLVRLGDWLVIDGCWQRVGSLGVQAGMWLRGLHTGQLSLYMTMLVLTASLWLLLFVRR
ncbi:hypothetical protein Spb1_38640 [Planctopirus ephydatiae]|uniref:Uncharacterized protein n=1 Tax=Planctopirus ephydatiae TaxID=2528019 RepID=A0A518GTK7_9PLAN|nr:hypothetical protein Spb1_38640 [Planctopirus ephydatiae]